MGIIGITEDIILNIESKYKISCLKDEPNDQLEFISSNIIKLINDNLSEPYSVYVYIYFLKTFPELCFYISDKNENIIACIIGKYDEHKSTRLRGYIGMLVVDENKRGESLGKFLIQKILHKFSELNCDDVILETQCNNTSALSLYKKFGFICLKKYKNYYNENEKGKDAFMLILGLTPKSGKRGAFLRQELLE
ncbi:hypothetical protein QEN19_003763 [Hanseniaspora menglaensis]